MESRLLIMPLVRKLKRKGVDLLDEPYTKLYVGGVEFVDGGIDAIYHSDGRIKLNEDDSWQFEY